MRGAAWSDRGLRVRGPVFPPRTSSKDEPVAFSIAVSVSEPSPPEAVPAARFTFTPDGAEE